MKNEEMQAITPEAARAEIEYLYEAGKEAANDVNRLAAPQPFEAFGRQYIFANGDIEKVEPERLIKPAAFGAYSLDGLIDYIQADVDGFFNDPEQKCLVRVANAREVEVLTPVRGP